MTLPKVTIFSDGGASPNPGPGGYGVILECKGIKKELSEGYKKTTNNRMELSGVIAGLSALKQKSKVTIITDSQYTINGIEKGWAKSWQKNAWKKSGNKAALNADLWEKLLSELEKHEVTFFWIKGHSGHPENERCDELATLAMNKKNLRDDEGYNALTLTLSQMERGQAANNNSLQNSLPLQGKEAANNNSLLNSLPLQGKEAAKVGGNKTGTQCKKCGGALVEKTPKHTKKTLEKKYFYAYYHHCQGCKTNYMLEEAKRDVKELRI